MSPTLAKLLARAICSRAREVPAGRHWSLHTMIIPCIMTLGLRHARLLLPLRVPLPVRLRGLLQLLKLLRNPPRLVGFHLALLHLAHVMTRRPVRVSRSRQLVTPLQLGWLTSFMRSALTRPLFAPRCGFEAWFGQPEAAASTQRFRMYPRVAEVQEEVAARSESLARRSKPLSRVIPARACTYALADDAVFASSQPVNSAFAQLAGSRALGSRHWGSLTFSDMERLERLFQGQLEVTSSSLWLLPGFLAMLKLDRFQPSDLALFNTALSSVFCCLVTSGAYGCCRLWLPSCQASGELTRPYHSRCSRISEALPDYHSRVVFWIF